MSWKNGGRSYERRGVLAGPAERPVRVAVELEGLNWLAWSEAEMVRECVHAIRERSINELDAIANSLRAWLPDWFVYRGGSHVALHRNAASGSPRLVIWKEVAL